MSARHRQKLKGDFALLDQMKRAGVSIAANVAEGLGRGTRKQNIELCDVAKGSTGELRSQVILADDNGLIDERACGWRHERCETGSRKLSAYIASLQRTRDQFPGLKHKLARLAPD